MTDPKGLSPFASAAPDLVALGYHVLPIIPPTARNHGGRGKAPGHYSVGLWQGMAKWEQHRDTPASEFMFDLWTRFPDANIGIVLGSPIGPLKLIAIDVDAVDPDHLRDILGALPHSPMCKRGAKGETRFYRASQEIKSTPYDRPGVGEEKPSRLVDLLTGFDTRQTVVPPSLHPDGQTYVWMEGPVPAADLPEFTADDLAVLEETLSAIGWVPKAQRATRAARPAGQPLPDADDFFTETKAAALANLDAWVHDLDVYDLRPARGGYEAVATWRPSSTGQPIAHRKRNLSIQPNGIKDFGTNWTGSAIDLVMEAQGLSQAEATSWLRMRLGLTGEVMVLEQSPRPMRSIEAPNSASPTRPAFVADPVCAEPYKEPVCAPAHKVTETSTELPDRLTHVPGLVGKITDWIVATSKRPQRGLSLGAAVTLVGTAAGRKVAGPTHSATHLYVLSIAATGAGKDHPLKCIGRILTAAGMKSHNGPSQFMSMSALINTLTRQPLTLSAMDEFGAFLKRVNGAKAGNHEQAISGIMRQVWGSSFGEIETPAYAQAASKTLVSPAFSIYGASTAEEFYAAVEGDDVLNGFLNRFLTISTKRRPAEHEPNASIFEVPDDVTAGMVAIYNIGGPLLGATSHNGQSNAPAVIVPWAEPQAKRVYELFGQDIEAREADMAFMSRTREMAVRLATIRAIGISSFDPKITVEDMEWARDLALWSAERMMEDAADYMAVNEHQAVAMRIMRVIKARGRIKHSDLLRAMQNRIRARDLKDHLSSLTDSGEISVEAVRPEAGGTAVQWYAAS